MKTVLVISTDPQHQRMYATGLKKFFAIEFERSKKADAVVYVLSMTHDAIDLKWLKGLDLPTVVLTPEDTIPLPKAANRCVLTYPVTLDRLLKTLAKLGVDATRPE